MTIGTGEGEVWLLLPAWWVKPSPLPQPGTLLLSGSPPRAAKNDMQSHCRLHGVRPLQWVSGSTWSCRCSSTHPPAFTFLTSSSAALLPVFSAGSPVPALVSIIPPSTNHTSQMRSHAPQTGTHYVTLDK